jgi:hypothetical protein
MRFFSIIFTAILVMAGLTVQAQSGSPQHGLLAEKDAKADGVTFLWTSPDGKVLENYIAPYSGELAQQNSWNEITLIMWGPAVNELATHEELQSDLAGLLSKGVEVKASERSAERYDAVQKLREMGVTLGEADQELTADIRGDASHLIDL